MKKKLFSITSLMLLGLSLVACGSEDSEVKTEEVEEVKTEEVAKEESEEELEEVVEEIEETEEEVEEEIDEDLNVELMEMMHIAILEENFAEIAEIEFDKGTKRVSIVPNEELILLGLLLAMDGSQEHIDSWEELVDSVRLMSSAFYANGLEGYAISMVNPSNKSNTLITAINGEITYDALYDD